MKGEEKSKDHPVEQFIHILLYIEGLPMENF